MRNFPQIVSARLRRFAANNRGNAMIELALAAPLLVTLGVGVSYVGLTLDRNLQIRQLANHAAAMATGGANLSASAVQQVLLRNADGLNFQASGGDGIIYVSEIQLGTSGANNGVPVITHQYRIGRTAVAGSQVGSPAALDANGHVSNFNTDTSARAALPTGMTLTAGQEIAIAEVFYRNTNLQAAGISKVALLRARAIY
jgi:hypothetical protein